MKISSALTLLFAAANATPLFEIMERDLETLSLEKRDTEIVYLANCVYSVSCCQGPTDYSEIIYYPTSAQGNSGAVASGNNQCTTSSTSWTNWEGATRSCRFPTGVTFTSRINSGAQSGSTGSYAGTGNNGKSWNCYKDNQRVIFTDLSTPEAARQCKSIYYCLPA